MAEAALAHYGPTLRHGLVIAHGPALEAPAGKASAQSLAKHFEILSASHPVPDESSLRAGQRALEWAHGLSAEHHAILLVSGGGSALACVPLEGLSMADKLGLHRQLLASGATISQMNTLRKHLSAIKGGRLALACQPATVTNLLLSDIPGDVAGDIASGPGVLNASTPAEAEDLARRLGVGLPPAVSAALRSSSARTPTLANFPAGAPTVRIVASAKESLRAALAAAQEAGLRAEILSDRLEVEASALGRMLAQMALWTADGARPAPHLLLSGGEASVTLHQAPPAGSRGGRSAETLLAFGLALAESALPQSLRVHALMADTDGIDGQGPAAGAMWGPDLTRKVASQPQAARQALANHDAHGFFASHGAAFTTGPTGTNVNDFRAILVMPPN